jgi:hypothetical protein
MAFPHLFWDGKGVDISDSQSILGYINHLIKFIHPKFQADPHPLDLLFIESVATRKN